MLPPATDTQRGRTVTILLTVNGERFGLRDPETISRLHAEIEAAVRTQGRSWSSATDPIVRKC